MKRLVLLLILLIFAPGLKAQIVSDSNLGFDFTPPEGWIATKKEHGYVMGSTHTQGFMLLQSQDFKSQKALKNAMDAGIEQEDGTMMMPVGELNMLGKQGVSGMYAGKIDEVEMKGFMMAFMPEGKGIAAIGIAVAPATVFNQSNMDQLKLLLRSVQLK